MTEGTLPLDPPSPPAVLIPNALAATEQALARMTDADQFEALVCACLRKFLPTLRPTGGAGDRQRDGEAGPLLDADAEPVLTVSLRQRWKAKVREDLAGLATHPPMPRSVVAATNRRTSRSGQEELVQHARSAYGTQLRVIDQRFLAGRLLDADMLHLRESALGLIPPSPPVALDPPAFRALLPNARSHQAPLRGRGEELDRIIQLLGQHRTVAVVGAGGLGKTRLLLAVADKSRTKRVLFLDDRSRLDAPRLPAELSGADDLLLVVDNAHRRSDLRQLVAMLERRAGDTRLVLIARDGYWNQLSDAVDGTPFGPLTAAAQMRLRPLANAAIAALLRQTEPELEYEGALRAIIALAEGNPQIALLGHGVASAGGRVEEIGANEVLAAHAESLVRSLAQGLTGADERDVLAFLGLVAALSWVEPEEQFLPELAAMLDLTVREFRRMLAEVADAGLLMEQGSRFSIWPDILSGHLLWSVFFEKDVTAPLSYRELWDASPALRERMCDALGGLPAQSVTAENAAAHVVARDLNLLAREHSAEALKLTQACAPGLPWLVEPVVDLALDHLPQDDGQRATALTAAAAVLQRTPNFEAAWPRQLRVAAELCALSSDEETLKEITEHLTGVYKRVPHQHGPDDGQVLAGVQHYMAEITADFWANGRGRPGVAHAVALASRQLLTVTVEKTTVSIEDDDIIHIGGGSLPVSTHTKRALATGIQLFVETLAHLSPAVQLRQAQELEAIQRTGRGAIRGLISVSPELSELVQDSVDDLRGQLAAVGNELPLVTRSAIEDRLGSVWPDALELDEYRELFADSFDTRRDIYDDQARATRARSLTDELLLDPDPIGRLLKWQAWMISAADAGAIVSNHVVADLTELAAQKAPEVFGDWLDELFARPGPLVAAASEALCVVLDQTSEGPMRAERASESPSAVVRTSLAWALSRSQLASRTDLLRRLASDPRPEVRIRVVDSLRFGSTFTEVDFDTGLIACRPDAVLPLALLFWRRNAEHDDSADLSGRLTDTQARIVRETVANAARGDEARGRHLDRLFEAVPQLPDLPIEYCLRRIDFLAGRAEPRDFSELLRIDTLPEEIADQVAAAADDAVRLEILNQVERGPHESRAHAARRELFEWVDDGGQVITERLADWLTRDDDTRREAREALQHELPAPQFKARALFLLVSHPELELEEDLVEAREPMVWSSSRRPDWRRLKAEYENWANDPTPQIAALGRRAVRRYTSLLQSDADPEDA